MKKSKLEQRRNIEALASSSIENMPSLQQVRYTIALLWALVLFGMLLLVNVPSPWVYSPFLMAWVFVFWLGHTSYFPRNWLERMDQAITAYEPIDKEAFQKLQDEVKGQRRPLVDCVLAWLEKESDADVQSQPPLELKFKFLQKQIKGN